MRRFARLLLAAAVLAAAAGGGLLIWAKTQPKPGLVPEDTHWSQAVTDRDGRLLHLTLSEDGTYRLPVLQGAVSREALDAVVRYEDRFFHSHPGVNPLSIGRAAWSTLTCTRRIGGSTITMQLARRLQGLDTRSWRGKLEQMLWALRYDMHYTKDEILTAYLTLTPYGGNVEGIEAASLVYFGKHASQLTAAESIALSVVPQNPVKRHPVTGPDFDRARLAVGRKAIDGGFVSERLRPVVEGPLKVKGTRALPFEAPHFTRLVEGTRPDPVLKTTLSLPLQESMEKILSENVARLRPYGIENGAMLVVDSRDMSVLAQVAASTSSTAPLRAKSTAPARREAPAPRSSPSSTASRSIRASSTLAPSFSTRSEASAATSPATPTGASAARFPPSRPSTTRATCPP